MSGSVSAPISGRTSITSTDKTVEIRNHRWLLRVDIAGRLNPGYLCDLERNQALANELYCYQFSISPRGEWGFVGGRDATHQQASGVLRAQGVLFSEWSASYLPEGGKEVRFRGRLDFGLLGPTDLFLEHTFRLPDDQPWFEEQIRLQHRFGRDQHAINDIRFGFRKTLYDRDSQAWIDGADRTRLVPVPHRRRWGQEVDYLADSYTMNDLVPGNWSGQQLPGRGAEAWVWTDGDAGYLIAKYDQTHIEFSLADGEFVLAPSKRGENYYQTFTPRIAGGANLCLRFGGVGRFQGMPESSVALGANADVEFGVTRIYPMQGEWQQGYGVYKAFLREKGHTFPPDFDPPVHWNELYNLGWRGGDNATLQELPELYGEAAIARDIGAEAFYFDPVWDVVEGTTLWDEERLGPLETFVRTMQQEYGLKTSLHLMMHMKTQAEDPRVYRRRKDGTIDPWTGLYQGGFICAGSPVWQGMKSQRLLKLAEAGVTFFMFDFLNYVPGLTRTHSHRLRDSECWAEDHGHEVPLQMQSHAEGILAVIQAVKAKYPQVLIEAHDRVNGGLNDFHPLYYQHGLPNSFDENWGFEYMWDPYMDLLSGKALSLYEYNLAYDIPLYLHIHCGQDNPQMLAFWWYASTCRHLGIGGVKDADSTPYQALKGAMREYIRLKAFFTRGIFVGVDTFIHAHCLPDQQAAVFVLFNLGSEAVTREVNVPIMDIGMDEIGVESVRNATGAEVVISDGRLRFTCEVAPLSPVVVEINTR